MEHLNSRAIILSLVLVTLSGCHGHVHSDQAEKVHSTHWSYSGATGPAHWGSLSPEYALCSNGKAQSPIDVSGADPVDLANISFAYKPTPLNIINNGHTVQVNCAPGSAIELEGVRYELAQFHFHLPSEHTIGGAHAEGEMHLVHKSASGRLAVVGVMLKKGASNSAFDVVANNLPESGASKELPGAMVNLPLLLPSDQRTFRYDGSLTTPPGTEGVRWCLMVEPVELSAAQLSAFSERYHGNNRPVQKLNGRRILKDTSK